MDIVISAQNSISNSRAYNHLINVSYKIKVNAAQSRTDAETPDIRLSYNLKARNSYSISKVYQANISFSVNILAECAASLSAGVKPTRIRSRKRVVIYSDIAGSLSRARKPSLAYQGNIIFPANTARNKSESPVVQLTIGFPVAIQAKTSHSKSISLSSSIRYNLLDYINYGDDIYLLISDGFGNVKMYRGIVKSREPQDRLLTIRAITGDGILSERIIKEDYPAQDIGKTAKEIIDTYCSPLTSNNVDINTGIIAPVPANKKTPLSVFESLRREYGINYYVDYAWDVHVYLERSIYGTSKYILKLGDG